MTNTDTASLDAARIALAAANAAVAAFLASVAR
jgi:hypothetical protein